MIGAIVGDIVGSVYEWNNIKTKDFPLFREDCFFTDDTVMTCAVAEAIMEGGTRDAFIDAMKKYGKEADVSEDEVKELEQEVQKLTDRFIAEIDKAVEAKSKEIMTV